MGTVKRRISTYMDGQFDNQNQQQAQEPVQSEGVQSLPDQGSADGQSVQGQNQSQQAIDYEKAYRNLEKEFTKRSQKLKQLEAWEKFTEETGITAEMALQQLEAYKQQFQQVPASANGQQIGRASCRERRDITGIVT